MNIEKRQTNHEQERDISYQQINNQCRQVLYQLNCLCQQSSNKLLQSPTPRVNPQLVYYKNKLYLYGGFELQQNKEEPGAFYSFDLQTKKWSVHFPKAFSHQFIRFKPKTNAVAGNKWFVLGSEKDLQNEKESGKIWKLNFDLMDWIVAQQKGEVIKHLQGGNLVSYQKNFLLYYGGYSQIQNKFNNSVYLYNIDSKAWHKCQGSYQKTVKSRFNAGMVNLNNKIFLFGGYYKQTENLQCLNDFYEITLRLSSKGIHAEAYFRLISTNSPSPRAQHLLFAYQNNKICIFGGKNAESNTETELWSFHTITGQWTLIDRIQEKVSKRQGSSIVLGGNLIYLFGGIQEEQNQNQRLCGDLWSLTVNCSKVYSRQQQFDKIEYFLSQNYSPSCKICYEKKHDFVMNTCKFSANIIDEAISLINFPYAAFGLLLDKSISLGATVINVSIEGEQSSHYICIEDNAKTLFNSQDLMRAMYSFEGTTNLIMSGFDKKTKKQIQKENLLKEFGMNLKIGALRLGKKFLFVSGNGETIHLFLCGKDKQQPKQANSQNNQQASKEVYVIRYYAVDANTKQLLSPEMLSTQEYIQSRYRKQVKLVTASRAIKNTLFIFETILNSNQQRITVSYQTNDVVYGDRVQIDKLTSYGYNMSDCLDVSLRAYFSLLYLRCELIKINFGIRHSTVTVIPQLYLQKIDKACRTGHIIELQDVLQFDFKLVEIYWQRELRRNNHFFSNGLLIYSKNRFICRYRIELGGLLHLMAKQVTSLTNYLPFFGYAQLPEHIPVNIFKTGFSFNILVEKLFCRLKFVEQGFKKRQSLLTKVVRLSGKNDRRQKKGDEYVWGYKKRSRKPEPINQTNFELPLEMIKEKNNNITDIQNVAFFIKQKQEENKSNEQFLKTQKVEIASQQIQQKQEVLHSEYSQK